MPRSQGSGTLEKALKKYYAVIWHDDGMRPLPWTIILRHFQRAPQSDPWAGLQDGLEAAYEGGRLRMRRVYCHPASSERGTGPGAGRLINPLTGC
jgi:hypothetical protein